MREQIGHCWNTVLSWEEWQFNNSCKKQAANVEEVYNKELLDKENQWSEKFSGEKNDELFQNTTEIDVVEAPCVMKARKVGGLKWSHL